MDLDKICVMCVTVFALVVVLTVGSCQREKKKIIADMVANGADPIEAMYAISDQGSGFESLILAGRRCDED